MKKPHRPVLIRNGGAGTEKRPNESRQMSRLGGEARGKKASHPTSVIVPSRSRAVKMWREEKIGGQGVRKEWDEPHFRPSRSVPDRAGIPVGRLRESTRDHGRESGAIPRESRPRLRLYAQEVPMRREHSRQKVNSPTDAANNNAETVRASQLNVANTVIQVAILCAMMYGAFSVERLTARHFQLQRSAAYVERLNSEHLVRARATFDNWLRTGETLESLIARSIDRSQARPIRRRPPRTGRVRAGCDRRPYRAGPPGLRQFHAGTRRGDEVWDSGRIIYL